MVKTKALVEFLIKKVKEEKKDVVQICQKALILVLYRNQTKMKIILDRELSKTIKTTMVIKAIKNNKHLKPTILLKSKRLYQLLNKVKYLRNKSKFF